LPVIEGKLGGLEAKGGVEVGGVGGEEVVDGGVRLAGAEPGGDEVMLGGQIGGVLLEVAAPEDGGLHGGEVVGFDLEEEAEGGEVAWLVFEVMFQQVAGAGEVLILIAGLGELDVGGGSVFDEVEEGENFRQAAEPCGGGEDGEKVTGGVQTGEMKGGLKGSGFVFRLEAGGGESGEPGEVVGAGRWVVGELPPVEVMLGVLTEGGLDEGDECGGVLAEAGKCPGDIEGGEVGRAAGLQQRLEGGEGLGELAGGEVEAGELTAGVRHLCGVIRCGRVVQPVAEEAGGFVGLLGGEGGVDEGLYLGPGGDGMAGGLGEELELEEGGLIGLGTGGEGLEELEAEGVCFIEGELFEDAWGIAEGRWFDADEAGLQDAAEERGVLGEAGGEKEAGALIWR
jgi:hypothetical protein